MKKIYEVTIPIGIPMTLFVNYPNPPQFINIISEREIVVTIECSLDKAFYRYNYDKKNRPIYNGKEIDSIRWSELEKDIIYKQLSL